MTTYRIIAETGADIPQDLQERYNIAIVPMHVSLGDDTFDDGSIPIKSVFEYYDRTGLLPKTSGSTPHDFERVFDELHEQYPEAHFIHLAYSAVTTCSYDSARTAAEGRDYVSSFDTKSVSAGQAMVVTSIAELLEQQPNMPLNELTEAIEDRINRIRMGFFPRDLEYLRAGGRVSNVAFMGAHILRIKPLIEILEGKLTATKKYRGSSMQVAKKLMQTWPAENKLAKDRLFFIYSQGLEDDIKAAMDATAQEMGFEDVRWVQTGCVVSSHGGPGAFGIVGFSEE